MAILYQQTGCQADTSRSKPLTPTDDVFFTKNRGRPRDGGDTGDIITPNHHDYTAAATNIRTRIQDLFFSGTISRLRRRVAIRSRSEERPPAVQKASFRCVYPPDRRPSTSSQSRRETGFWSGTYLSQSHLAGENTICRDSSSVHVAFDLSVSHRYALHLASLLTCGYVVWA